MNSCLPLLSPVIGHFLLFSINDTHLSCMLPVPRQIAYVSSVKRIKYNLPSLFTLIFLLKLWGSCTTLAFCRISDKDITRCIKNSNWVTEYSPFSIKPCSWYNKWCAGPRHLLNCESPSWLLTRTWRTDGQTEKYGPFLLIDFSQHQFFTSPFLPTILKPASPGTLCSLQFLLIM